MCRPSPNRMDAFHDAYVPRLSHRAPKMASPGSDALPCQNRGNRCAAERDLEMSRCDGQCCYAFPLWNSSRSFGPGDLEELAATSIDGAVIAAMLIPLEGPWPEGASPRWTCRHFDGAGCTDYENRPKLCRDHGAVHRCDVPGCTLERPFDVHVSQLRTRPKRSAAIPPVAHAAQPAGSGQLDPA